MFVRWPDGSAWSIPLVGRGEAAPWAVGREAADSPVGSLGCLFKHRLSEWAFRFPISIPNFSPKFWTLSSYFLFAIFPWAS